MTSKATVYIIDIHSSMVSNNAEDFLKQSKYIVQVMLHEKIIVASKRDFVSVLLLGSDDTFNQMSQDEPDAYENMSIFFPEDGKGLKSPTVSLLRSIEGISPSKISNSKGDAFESIVVATDLIHTHKGKSKANYELEIYLFTDGNSFIQEANRIQPYVDILLEIGIVLKVVLPQLVKSEAFIEGSESVVPADYDFFYRLTSELLKDSNSFVCSFEDALRSAQNPHKKKFIQTSMFNGTLDFGDTLRIPVRIVTKTTEFKPPSLKRAIWKNEAKEFVNLDQHREYRRTGDTPLKRVIESGIIQIPPEEETEAPIDKDDLVEYYQYGETSVKVDPMQKELMENYDKEKGLKFLFFASREQVKVYHYMSGVYFVYADPGNSGAEKIVSCLVSTMKEKNVVALVRFTRTKASNTRMGALIPLLDTEEGAIGFYLIYLPYFEDIRDFDLNSLPTEKVILGDHLCLNPKSANSKISPSPEQLEACSNLVEQLDFDKIELELEMEEIYHPYYQRLKRCILARALHPSTPGEESSLPDPDETVLSALRRNPELWDIESSMEAVKKFDSVCKCALNPPKEKKRRVEAVASEITVDELLESAKISNKNDTLMQVLFQDKIKTFLVTFKAKIEQPGDFVSEGVKEFASNIRLLLKEPGNISENTGLFIECLRELRRVCSEEDESEQFNNLMEEIKMMHQKATFYSNTWFEMKKENINLISEEEAKDSAVKSEELKRFYEY